MNHQIHLFDRSKNVVTMPAGHVIFSAGDPGNCMYAVLSGAVDIIVHDETVETVEAGGVFGEMALIEEKPRSASAVVKTEARLVPVDRTQFLFLVQQTPFFALQLLGIVTERLRRLMSEKL